jgi:hypothetical protein
MTIDLTLTFSYFSIFLTSIYFLLDSSNRIVSLYTLFDNSVVVVVIFVYPLLLSCHICYYTALLAFSLSVIRYLLFITVYHRVFLLWLVVAYSGLSRHALVFRKLGTKRTQCNETPELSPLGRRQERRTEPTPVYSTWVL